MFGLDGCVLTSPEYCVLYCVVAQDTILSQLCILTLLALLAGL